MRTTEKPADGSFLAGCTFYYDCERAAPFTKRFSRVTCEDYDGTLELLGHYGVVVISRNAQASVEAFWEGWSEGLNEDSGQAEEGKRV